jgi:hypothetical protein
MKYIILTIVSVLYFLGGFSQSSTTTIIYEGKGNVIGGFFIRIPQGKP